MQKKINRYWFSLLIIVVVTAIPYLFRSGLPLAEALAAMGIISAIVYFFYLLYVFTVGRAIKSDLFAILSGIAVALGLPGILFKIMHWPGGGLFTRCAAGCLALLIVIDVVERFKKTSNK